ncbi:MAG: molybdopterin molybdotransferase MoeA [Acidobacteria bacterium]|nr:molybdopterin molybdotransferase MoeA [Acidobacteriota bacterium]
MTRFMPEIDEGAGYIGYPEAYGKILSGTGLLGCEAMPIGSAVNRIAAEDVVAPNSYPSSDISLKDGFAVKTADVARATGGRAVSLEVIGTAYAGTRFRGQVSSGSAVGICSGAPIPPGADAVVSVEFSETEADGKVRIHADAEKGRNILRAGAEVRAGSVIVEKGSVFSPGIMGLAAAAGISEVEVCRRPTVALIGIGDEVVVPGNRLRSSQIYASNLVTLGGWLQSFGIGYALSVVKDNKNAIGSELRKRVGQYDAIVTSGGAWGSERDLVVGVLDSIGWEKVFHRVRMGPGKGIAFGFLDGRPVFCLPGGPASNEMAFLQLAFPGILHMSGVRGHPLQSVPAILLEDVKGRSSGWTEFRDAGLSKDPKGCFQVGLYRNRSRLQAIAVCNGLICIPEGRASLRRGELVPVQVLAARLDGIGCTSPDGGLETPAL